MSSFHQRVVLMKSLCRICGNEEKNCISVFSESGKKQEIDKKIRLCLPLTVDESDALPTQICLTCLHKLDASWEFLHLCKSGQVLIERKLYNISENNNGEKTLFMIDERLKSLTEDRPITVGNSVVITLEPAEQPPPPQEAPPPSVTSEAVVGIVPTYHVSAPATTVAPTTPSVDNNVYPQGLIEVLQPNKPVLYQQRSNEVKQSSLRRNVVPPMKRSIPISKRGEISTTEPTKVPRRSLPSTSKGASKQRNSPAPKKKALRMCTFCKKPFPDEIIDHHVSLHLRQSFSTCLECNKNFRSEMAMSRHRCGTTDTSTNDNSSIMDTPIDLDPDDDLICL